MNNGKRKSVEAGDSGSTRNGSLQMKLGICTCTSIPPSMLASLSNTTVVIEVNFDRVVD